MALSQQGKALVFRLKPFLAFQRFQCGFVGRGGPPELPTDTGEENPRWQKLDSVKLGIVRSMISRDSWRVVKGLQNAGFEAYLVGGCVRDLLLSKVPKDFDVITTARLEMVKKKFQRAIIVGRRFPVCRVITKDSVVEVTAFGTVDKQIKRKQLHISQPPPLCDQKDLALWNNSMHRDFTINSLFYDPSRNIIYDYIGAMMDLRSLELRTITPADVSFKEDQARILRAVRLAARLNLSFSKETEDAIYNLSPSVTEISEARLSLEVNYMLSYGAAESSLLLLKRFNLLDILLPFQAAYLSEQADSQLDPRSLMLTKLFSNLDRLITCAQPCHESMWVSLLSFHLALFNNPQHPIVVLTFASLLYHGTWEKSIKFARKHAPAAQIYHPESLDACDPLTDDEIEQRVVQLAVQVKNSVSVFINSDSLLKAMARFPEFSCSGLIIISRKMGQRVEDVFKILVKDVTALKADRQCLEINYTFLGGGKTSELRFVLGRIIIETLVISELGMSKVEKGYTREYVQPKKPGEVFKQIQHALKHPRRFERSTSPSNHELLPGGIAGKARLFRDDDTVSNNRVSRKLGGESSDFCGDNVEKDKHVKTEVQKTPPSLSSLFK